MRSPHFQYKGLLLTSLAFYEVFNKKAISAQSRIHKNCCRTSRNVWEITAASYRCWYLKTAPASKFYFWARSILFNNIKNSCLISNRTELVQKCPLRDWALCQLSFSVLSNWRRSQHSYTKNHAFKNHRSNIQNLSQWNMAAHQGTMTVKTLFRSFPLVRFQEHFWVRFTDHGSSFFSKLLIVDDALVSGKLTAWLRPCQGRVVIFYQPSVLRKFAVDTSSRSENLTPAIPVQWLYEPLMYAGKSYENLF